MRSNLLPESTTQRRRRLSAGRFLRLVRLVLSVLPDPPRGAFAPVWGSAPCRGPSFHRTHRTPITPMQPETTTHTNKQRGTTMRAWSVRLDAIRTPPDAYRPVPSVLRLTGQIDAQSVYLAVPRCS